MYCIRIAEQKQEVADMLKKGVKTVALALSFGVAASVSFQGSNYVINQWMGQRLREVFA